MQITGLIEDVVQSYINLVVSVEALKSENEQLKLKDAQQQALIKNLESLVSTPAKKEVKQE